MRIDGSLHIDNTTWMNGSIAVRIYGLDVGEHFYTINVYDLTENMVTDTVLITILDQSISSTLSTSSTQSSSTTSSTQFSNYLSIVLFLGLTKKIRETG